MSEPHSINTKRRFTIKVLVHSLQKYMKKKRPYCSSTMLSGAILLLVTSSALGWDPDAGLVVSYTKMAGVKVTATSNQAEASKAVDGNDNTQWNSGKCLPTGYIPQADHNVLLAACEHGECQVSSSSGNVRLATDGNTGSTLSVNPQGGQASFTLTLLRPQSLELMTLQGRFDGGVAVTASVVGGKDTVVHLSSTDDWHAVRFNLSGQAVTSIKLTSGSSFILSELAALSGSGCVERLAVDFGSPKEVAFIRTRHWAGDGTVSSRLVTSMDGKNWSEVTPLNPATTNAVENEVKPPRQARFVAVEHRLMEKDWAGCYVWEIDAWGGSARFGPAPSPQPNPASMGAMLGVNGIWGWGNRVPSSSLGQGQGAFLYDQVSSHARNYHSMVWDITKPGQSADYDKMSQGHGTAALSWVNWDTEYAQWVKANLSVDASLQFRQDHFPPSAWTDPVNQGHTYGLDFATHFGPSHKNLVQAAEVGNEPWDYTGALYSQILQGMARGLKEGDSKITVLPGAFQAHDKNSERPPMANYIGPRVTSAAAPYIDVINAHFYSFFYRPDGVRITVHPEHPGSEFNGIRNMLRWRDVNMPGKPVWMTEWGWDSPGASQTCTFSECVSENAAALYGLRGLLLLARYGVEKATWFFYANLDQTECPDNHQHIFCRSGLTGSKETGFAKKAVFYAFRHLLDLLADKHFLGVVREDDQVYAYLFGDLQQGGAHQHHVTHVVAWRPVDGDDKTLTHVTLDLRATPQHAWRLTSSQSGPSTEQVPRRHGDQWTVDVSAEPLVVEVSGNLPDIHPVG